MTGKNAPGEIPFPWVSETYTRKMRSGLFSLFINRGFVYLFKFKFVRDKLMVSPMPSFGFQGKFSTFVTIRVRNMI